MTDEKRQVVVRNLAELTSVVDGLIETGATDVNINFTGTLLLDPEAWKQLERLTVDHAASKPAEEVVSYASNALGEQEHWGLTYKVEARGSGFSAHVHMRCAGWFEPFDLDFPTILEAHEHATGYIEGEIERAEAAAKIKAALKAKHPSNPEHDTFST